MAYKPTRRNWVKLWVDEWLSGTTRFELNEGERSVWADFIALAGRSKYPGIIASGKYDDGYRGYPLNYLAGVLVVDIETIKSAIVKCENYGKIRVEKKNHDGAENIIIYVLSFEKYQSEYLRQRPYYKNSEELGNTVDINKPDNGIAKENQTRLIFDFWNEQPGLIHHESFKDDYHRAIMAVLKDTPLGKIKTAIINYCHIITSEEYFFKYKWTLKDFLKRGLDKFLDLEIAKNNYRRDKTNGGKGASGKRYSAAERQASIDRPLR